MFSIFNSKHWVYLLFLPVMLPILFLHGYLAFLSVNCPLLIPHFSGIAAGFPPICHTIVLLVYCTHLLSSAGSVNHTKQNKTHWTSPGHQVLDVKRTFRGSRTEPYGTPLLKFSIGHNVARTLFYKYFYGGPGKENR